jgi:hypothetical protein
VIAIVFDLTDPTGAVNTPTLLALINEFFNVIHHS